MPKSNCRRWRHRNVNSELLLDHMDVKNNEDTPWFFEFLSSIFESPDMDYSQFQRMEAKKTRHQIERSNAREVYQ